MDEIQSYSTHSAAPSPLRVAAAPLAINPAAVKTTSNYLKALRRRVWVVLAIAVPLSIVACIYILRMPPVYIVKAEIEINPPDYDPALATLVSHDIGRRDPGSQERYVPNRAAQLKSRRLHETRRQRTPSLQPELSQYEDPATELFRSLNVLAASRRTATPSSSPSRETTPHGPRSCWRRSCSTSRRRRRTTMGTRSRTRRSMPIRT